MNFLQREESQIPQDSFIRDELRKRTMTQVDNDTDIHNEFLKSSTNNTNNYLRLSEISNISNYVFYNNIIKICIILIISYIIIILLNDIIFYFMYIKKTN